MSVSAGRCTSTAGWVARNTFVVRDTDESCDVGHPLVQGCKPEARSKTIRISMCEGVQLSPLSRLRLTPETDERRCTAGDLPTLVPMENSDLVHEVHHFSERANWLVPGKVLLGKYPGQIPADLLTEPNRQIARDRVLDIVLRGGVTDFFCLQAELPPQDDESRWSPPPDEHDNGFFFSGFRAYRGDAVAAVAAAAAASSSATTRKNTTAATAQAEESIGLCSDTITAEVGAIGGGGLRGVGAHEEQGSIWVELGAAAGAGVGTRGKEGLAFHHFPIPDLSPAESTEFLGELVDELEALVASGKVPFIHCWAGRGRTGLIASCLLGRLYPELSATQSLNRVDGYYRTRGTVAIGKSSRVSPETEEQAEQVRMFFKQVLNRE